MENNLNKIRNSEPFSDQYGDGDELTELLLQKG